MCVYILVSLQTKVFFALSVRRSLLIGQTMHVSASAVDLSETVYNGASGQYSRSHSYTGTLA